MNLAFQEEVGELEILSALSSFQKCKISGLDGLTVEFYIGFFDLLKDDLFKVVNESKSKGRVLIPFNLTHLDLIPKFASPSSFDDFHPISCCKLIYKLISKVIVNRLKPILSELITDEQFSFLFNRQIHDVVSITQEELHTVKEKKLSGLYNETGSLQSL
jgi:hypothetical protein